MVQGLTQARSCFLALKIMSFARVGRPLAPDVLEEKRTTAADARRRQTHDGGGGGGRADGGGFDENRVREHVLECGPCLPLPARSTPLGALACLPLIQKIVSQEGTHAGSAAAAATSLFLAVVVEFVDDCPRPLH